MIDLNKPKADAFDLGAFIIEAVGVLREHGLDVDPTSLDTSGELVRCPVDGKPGGKDGAYVVHLDPPQTVICWNHVMGGETVTHQSGHIKSLSPEDRAAIRARTEAAREKRAADLANQYAKAANKALKFYELSSTEGAATHPYAVKKRLDFGPLVRRREYCGHDCLVVPLYGEDGQIWTVQAIAGGPVFDGNRDKTLLAGARKAGCFLPIGPTFRGASRVVIAEGLATAAAIHAATGLPCLMAVDKGNLIHVARVVRELAAPGAEIVIFADDDQPDPDGIAKAEAAAKAVGGVVAVPAMGKKADAWDVWNEKGPGAVAACIEAALAGSAESDKILSGIFNGADLLKMDLPEIKWAVPGLLPAGLVILAGGPKLGKSWLIYGVVAGVGAGGLVLGYFRSDPGKVLYLALEDSKKRLQDRLRSLCQIEPDIEHGLARVDFQTTWPRFDDEGGLDKLESYIVQNIPAGLKLVVIDTMAKVGPKAKAKGLNAYENDSLTMGRIKAMADKHGICILLITHMTKIRPSKDPFDAITGSMGQFGTADTAMLLARTRGADTAKLLTTGRDIEGHTYGLRWLSPGWTCTGIDDSEPAPKLTQEREAVLQVFRDNTEPMSPAMVAHAIGKTPKTASFHIKKLEEGGFLFSVGYGLYCLAGSAGSGGSAGSAGSAGSDSSSGGVGGVPARDGSSSSSSTSSGVFKGAENPSSPGTLNPTGTDGEGWEDIECE